MSSIRRVASIVLLSALATVAQTARCLAVPQAGFTEYRSIFIDRFDFNYTSSDIPAMTSAINAQMQNAADNGFTEVIWQVRGRADALYNSNIEPDATGLTPGFDPLQTALDAAHARGLKLHAWINATPMWNSATVNPPTSPLQHIYHQTNPTLRLMDINGDLEPPQGWSNYASANAILPEVHDHINNVVSDITSNYAVDGIHLDYIRYIPGTLNTSHFARMPHDPVSHQMFFQATGLDGSNIANFQAYKTFLTDRITDLVRSVKENVDAAEIATGRTMELTASLFFDPHRAKTEYAQDFGRWINEGLLDVAMPMIYLAADNDHLFDSYLQNALSFVNPDTGTRVQPNLASYLHMNPARGGGVDLTLSQIQRAYNFGAHGVGFYDYPAYFGAYSVEDRQRILDYFASIAPPDPLPPGGRGTPIDDFEVDEGHFHWVYNASPVSQTFGLTAATTVDRVTHESHAGVGSQLLSLVSDGSATWQLRHNSGDSVVAHPNGNVALEATGYVGFWLKTDDPGLTVRIAIDDPVAAGATAIEFGISQTVAADDQWHLYQWNFEDADDWFPLGNAGSDGDIDATSGFVSIDSLWFAGAGNAQIYLDTLVHNPDGPLEGMIAGDYNHDHEIDADDSAAFRAAFGQNISPTFGADGNGDGIIDIGDYIIWRKMMEPSGGGSSAIASPAVPEPSTQLLLTAAATLFRFRRTTRRTDV